MSEQLPELPFEAREAMFLDRMAACRRAVEANPRMSVEGLQAWVNELTYLSPYNGEECYFIGKGHKGEITTKPDGTMLLTEGMQHFVDSGMGSYVTLQPVEHGILGPWQSFIVSQQVVTQGLTRQIVTTDRVFMDTQESHITLVEHMATAIDPIDQTKQSAQISELDLTRARDVLNNRSDNFLKLIRSTKFRRLNHRAQQQQVDHFIYDTEIASGVCGLPVIAEPQYGYKSAPVLEGVIKHQSIGFGGLTITGVVAGIHMVGRELLQAKAIRRDADLLTKYEGLSLSVELDNVSEDMAECVGVAGGAVIHLPITGQDFDLLFLPKR